MNFLEKRKNGLMLTTPDYVSNMNSAGWTHENKWLRSRVTRDGKIVSQGFGKFLNLGEPGPLGISLEDIKGAKDVVVTKKLDGSLLILSDLDGKPYIRSRGSLDCDHFTTKGEIEQFFKDYPLLNNSRFYAGLSLLFEWETPSYPIVFKPTKIKFTLIGAVRHSPLSYIKLDELKTIRSILRVPLVDHYILSDIDAILNFLEENKTEEGFVLRLNKEQDLVKLKTKFYLKLHSFLSSISKKNLYDLWVEQGQPLQNSFENFIQSFYSPEVYSHIKPVLDELFAGIDRARGLIKQFEEFVELNNSLSRKDFAILSKNIHPEHFHVIMTIYSNKEVDLKKMII